MKYILLFLFPTLSLATTLPPTPFPVFLRAGFSSVLDFEESPTKVVLGDAQSFQVERLGKSIVLKTLANYATTNMFVYFQTNSPKLFVLTASEDAEPTYYKKFESPKIQPPAITSFVSRTPSKRLAVLMRSRFDVKKDYLTVEVRISSDSNSHLKPQWKNVALRFNKSSITPFTLWAERTEIQRDSSIRTRFIFARPNLPRNLKGVNLVIPISGSTQPFVVALRPM